MVDWTQRAWRLGLQWLLCVRSFLSQALWGKWKASSAILDVIGLPGILIFVLFYLKPFVTSGHLLQNDSWRIELRDFDWTPDVAVHQRTTSVPSCSVISWHGTSNTHVFVAGTPSFLGFTEWPGFLWSLQRWNLVCLTEDASWRRVFRSLSHSRSNGTRFPRVVRGRHELIRVTIDINEWPSAKSKTLSPCGTPGLDDRLTTQCYRA